MDARFKKLKLNTYLSLLYQVLLLICGFILPKSILYFYGSQVNGLVSSITQFLSFINICDMGISAVVSSAYYKPLAEGNAKRVNEIYVYSRNFFKKIGCVLCIYIIFLLLFYPKLTSEKFPLFFTASLILVMSISQFTQYFFGISCQILINADQKNYVQLLINGATLILNVVICLVIMILGGGIHTVKICTALIYLLRPVLMMIYVKKNYSMKRKVQISSDVIPQKWNGVIQHIAYTICENTDTMVLTIFSSIENVSIYSIYILVTGGIKAVINACTNSFLSLFGNIIAKNEKELLSKTYATYEWIIHTISCLLYTITGILIVPFVLLYTHGIEDADYNTPIFAILIVVAYLINCIRTSMHTVIKAAGHYKQTQLASLIEASLNILFSIALVYKFGLIGVAIGTIIAAIYFTIYEVIYLNNHILFWEYKKIFRRLLIDIIQVSLIIGASLLIKMNNENFLDFVIYSSIITTVSIIISTAVQLIFERKRILDFIN